MEEKNNFSVVIPVYNEEGILRESIKELISDLNTLKEAGFKYEIIICENGSSDSTMKIGIELSKDFPVVRIEHLEIPSYGEALRYGIGAATYEKIIIFNIDFWDIDFLKKTLNLLDRYDCIIGSKVIKGAVDERPLLRRLITRWFNLVLRLLFSFRGTDTHGIKGFRKSSIYPIAMQCLTEREIFDTELLLRADRGRLSICEVPVTIREVRLSRLNPIKRVPSTFMDLFKLYIALQFRPIINLNLPHYEHEGIKDNSYQKVRVLYGKLAENEISFVTGLALTTVRDLQERINKENGASRK